MSALNHQTLAIIPSEIWKLLTQSQQIKFAEQITNWQGPHFIGFDGGFLYIRANFRPSAIPSYMPSAIPSYNHILIVIAPSGEMTTCGIQS